MQSHLEGSRRSKQHPAALRSRPGMLARVRRSACEEFVLLGPVERQIEFAQPRRGERDGEPALQDRVDEKRAQEGEVDQFLPYPGFRFRVRGAKSILGCPRLFCS